MKRQMLMMGLLLASICAEPVLAQVSAERLRAARQELHNWLTYSGDYAAWRYSALDQINTNNVEHLAVQWVFQTDVLGAFETTPLVIDGVMYLTGQDNRAAALDARTGRVIWRYRRALPEKLPVCCGRVNRGFAALGDKLFMG